MFHKVLEEIFFAIYASTRCVSCSDIVQCDRHLWDQPRFVCNFETQTFKNPRPWVRHETSRLENFLEFYKKCHHHFWAVHSQNLYNFSCLSCFFQGCGAVIKMTLLRLRISLFSQHGSGSGFTWFLHINNFNCVGVPQVE